MSGLGLRAMNDRELAVQAWESLFRAQHAIFTDCADDFNGTELTQSEYDVLLTVVRAPGQQAKLREVTAQALISQPSVSRLVDRMVTRGLVTKELDPSDGRGSIITATEEGARRFRRIGAKHASHIAQRMSALTPDELHTLMQLTQRLRGTH